MKKVHKNKLVRDKVPGIIASRGSEYEIRELGEDEFETELYKKVEEEARELTHAATVEECTAEIADLIDVIEEVKRVKGITTEAIDRAREEGHNRKGGFKKRLLLVWSSADEYYPK